MPDLFFGSTRKARALFAIVIVLCMASSAAAHLGLVYAPDDRPLGRSYSQHAARWWKWALSHPARRSPLLDASGASCAQGQKGDIWYLAGNVTGQPTIRSCRMPVGKTIIFPIVNAAWLGFEQDRAARPSEAVMRAQVDRIRRSQNLEVEIDGVPVPNLERYFERSEVFSVTLPANNIYELPKGFVLTPSVDAGFYIAIPPLSPGQHTIHSYAELPDGSVRDVTYLLTVGGREYGGVRD